MVSFNDVPSALRVPFTAVEFDASRAQQGPALLAYRALLIGQKTGAGTAEANSLHKVTSADQVATLAGRGSVLHRMAKRWFDNNKFTECWVGVLAENSATVYASGTITIAGPATAAGTIDLYVAGEHLQISVANADSANTIAAAIAAAIGVHASGTVMMGTPTEASDVTVAGVEFAATTGAVTPGQATYSLDSGGATAAASLAAQINAHATVSQLVRASANSTVCTIRSVAGGTAGNSIVLTSDDAVQATVSGSGTLAGGAAGDNEDLPVHASVNAAVVTLYAKNGGPGGNEIDVRSNYQDGEETPAGVTVTIVEPTSGATNPTLTSLISAMGDTWFNVVAHPYTDATSLSAIETELSSRFGPMRMIDGVAFTGASGSQATLGTLGDSRNSQHSCILSQPGENPLTHPAEFAAAVAAVVAYYGQIDPARPMQTLPITGVLAPAEADLFTNTERNLLLFDGIGTSKVAAGGVVQIERIVTTYQTNAADSPDTAYLDVTTMLTLMYLRYAFRVRVMNRYPRHKLGDDGTRFGSGQAVITPKLGKAEAIAWFREMEELGLVEGFDQFKRDLVVARNASDPNRLDFLLPPNVINQLIVCAAQIQFLL